MQRGHVRLPRFRVIRGAGFVGHVRRVVLVGQSREVVAELVDEDVLREAGVGRRRGLEVEDPASPVLLFVDQDLDELVRRGGRGVAKRTVVVRQQVAFRIEDVVLRGQRRAPELAGARATDPRCGGREIDAPHVEVVPPAAERLLLEERLGQPGRVCAELAPLVFRVPLAEDQQVDLLGRRSAREQRPDLAGRGTVGRIDEAGVRIDDRRPDLVKTVLRVAHLQHDLHRPPRPRKAQRLVERAMDLARLRRRLPLAVDRREAARVDHAVRPPVEHLEEIFPEVEVVDETGAAARPRPVGHHPIERDDLRAAPARVEIVDAHRLVDEVLVEARGGLRGPPFRFAGPVRATSGHHSDRDDACGQHDRRHRDTPQPPLVVLHADILPPPARRSAHRPVSNGFLGA